MWREELGSGIRWGNGKLRAGMLFSRLAEDHGIATVGMGFHLCHAQGNRDLDHFGEYRKSLGKGAWNKTE